MRIPAPTILVLDTEIKKKILSKNEEKDHAYEYCEGWHDFPGMGISVACAYSTITGRNHVFMSDNLGELQLLINQVDYVVGYNSRKFDSALLAANQITIPQEKHFDIQEEVWRAHGLDMKYKKETHGGLGLNAMVGANIYGLKKIGHGADAPALWQDGKVGEVIDYCMMDNFMTKKLLDAIFMKAGLWSPKDDGMWLSILPPSKRRDIKLCINCGREFQGLICPKCGRLCRS